ncbi:MAG: Fur family transcriptional regulator [Armatimonadota bacterium]
MIRPVREGDSLKALREACRRSGIPLTTQRSVIFEALAVREDHPTAEQILEDVRARLSEISRTTVYRVLDTLTKLGFASKTCAPGGAVRFDPRTERHHHLVCMGCDQVIDLQDPAFDALPMPHFKKSRGFEIRDYSVYFQGLCAACRRDEKRRDRAAGSSPLPKVSRRTRRNGS